MSSTTSLYRSLLRELRKSAVTPRVERSKAITTYLRVFFSSPQADPAKVQKDAQNALTFLQSQRIYKELLIRYNPLHDLTAEQRVRATARRVGLDAPIEWKAPEPS